MKKVILMNNKTTKPVDEVQLPELKVHCFWCKILDWISHVRHLYWIMILSVFLAFFFKLTPYPFWVSLYSKLREHTVLVAMVLIFGLVALSLIWKTGQRIDVLVFMYFNMQGKRSAWLDYLMLFITQLGSGFFATLVSLLLYFYLNKQLAFELAFGTLTLWLIVEVMKVIIRRDRPFVKLKSIRIIGSRASGHSFPSGHTSQTFFVATLIVNYFHSSLIVSLLIYAISLLVGITRIYVGMHYPRDVLGGAILGSAWGILGAIINNYIF